MGWNAAGSVIRTDGVRSGSDVHAQQKTAGVKVRADLTDTELEDLATAIENTVARDGQNAASANLPMGGFKHTGVTTSSGGSSRSEYTSGATVQDGAILDAGSTGGTTTAYTATLSPAIAAYADKQCFRIKFDATFGATPTINFNTVGAKKMYYMLAGTATQLTTSNVPANYVGLLRYDASLDGAAGAFLLLNPPTELFTASISTTLLATANTFTADQTIQSSDAGAGEAPSLILDRNSASPAASDLLGSIQWKARDSGAGTDVVAKIIAKILDATATSEDTQLLIKAIVAGTLTDIITAGPGVQIGAPTSGDMGAGTLNLDNPLYIDGKQVVPATTGYLQTVTAEYATNADLTTVVPFDDTIPQNTEGTQILTATITPKSTSNTIKIRAVVWGATATGGDTICLAAFVNSTASAIAAVWSNSIAANSPIGMVLEYTHSPASTSATTYNIRVGGAANTFRANGISTGRKGGGVSVCKLVLEEVVG